MAGSAGTVLNVREYHFVGPFGIGVYFLGNAHDIDLTSIFIRNFANVGVGWGEQQYSMR